MSSQSHHEELFKGWHWDISKHRPLPQLGFKSLCDGQRSQLKYTLGRHLAPDSSNRCGSRLAETSAWLWRHPRYDSFWGWSYGPELTVMGVSVQVTRQSVTHRLQATGLKGPGGKGPSNLTSSYALGAPLC